MHKDGLKDGTDAQALRIESRSLQLIRPLLTAVLFVTTAHADFDRQVPASNGSDLFVSTGSGHIQIHPGSDSGIHIRAHVYTRRNFPGGDVQDRIRQISEHPPIVVSGNTIRIGDTPPQENALYRDIVIDYEINAPRSVALNLRSGSGDIEVDNLGRFLKAETGSGSVRAHQIAGPADLRSGSGDVELQQIAPGDVHANTGSGSVRITGFSGALQARTGSGDIDASGKLTGAAHLQSGSGSIRLHLGAEARYTIDATTGSGSIRVQGNRNTDHHHLAEAINGGGQVLEVRTGSGDIEVN